MVVFCYDPAGGNANVDNVNNDGNVNNNNVNNNNREIIDFDAYSDDETIFCMNRSHYGT